jgi:hypothetical protein
MKNREKLEIQATQDRGFIHVCGLWDVVRCDVRNDFRIKQCLVRLYLQLLVGGRMS